MLSVATILAQDGHSLTASWGNQQNVHPIGLLMILIAGACMVLLKRKYAMLPIILIALYVTTAQRLVVGGLDFPFLRILVMLGWMRVLMMNESRGFRMIATDWAVILWAIAFFVANVAREGLFVYCCGWTIDNVGAYFLFRMLLRSRQEIFEFSWWLALLSIPVAFAFLLEKMTQFNIFSVFGGVRAHTWVREGKLRCMGAFQHPILAGCFFAGIFPILAIAWRGTLESRPAKLVSGAGMAAAITVVICCASSTPLISLMAGIGAMVLIKFHKMVPAIRWGTVFALFMLHFFIMKQPVWHLISRIDLTGGSTGYHRFRLIDAAIKRVDEWSLMGVTTTEHWGFHLYDVTNHFILQGTDGGMATFLLFLLVLALAFRSVRVVMKRSYHASDRWTAWMFGASLFANCMSFLGVSYFGKPLMMLMLQLAVLGSLEVAASRAPARAPVRRRMVGPRNVHLGAAN